MQTDFRYGCASLFVHPAYHFTGKEHDQESGNDFFLARYYTSTAGRFISPDWSGKAEAVPYATYDDPQSLNLYGYVTNNPMTGLDPDGHFSCNGANGNQIGCQMQAAWKAMANGTATSPDDYMQQQQAIQQAQQQNGSSGGGGFWSRLGQHFSNLAHFHSWNFGMRESVTVSILPAEPIPAVTAGTDAAGIVGLTSETAGKVLGPAGAAVSIANDRSPKNVTTNVLSLIPGFEGMAIPAALTDFMDWSIHNSSPGPKKVGDPTAPDELQPTLPTQDGGCLAAGMDNPC